MVSYNPLYFCIVCCNLSFFISTFVDLILLFLLMSLAKDLSILFIFSKNQLLFLLIFTVVSFISFSCISVQIFMISFLLLILGLFCSSFPSCFRCKVRLSIRCFSCFLRWHCIAINFPLRTAFGASHRFWVVVFSLSFVSRSFLISLLISSVTCYLETCCLISMCLCFLQFFLVTDI